MRIAVIDGQGGGVGKALVEKMRQTFGGDIEIIALGVNALATSLMLKAGADSGATGENAIVVNAPRVDAILGPIGIVVSGSLLGELTPAMARAVGESQAPKILIPHTRCNLHIAGLKGAAFAQCIDEAAQMLKTLSA